MAKFITAKEAAQLIPDGATVGVAGMGLSGWAEEVGRAMRDNFKETGHTSLVKQTGLLWTKPNNLHY